MEPRSLFEWRDVVLQLVGFLASFAMLGAVGFRHGVLRTGLVPDNASVEETTGEIASSAAGVGALGVGLGFASMGLGLLKRAEAKHVSFGDAFSAGGTPTVVQVALLAVTLVAFVLAWRRVAVGWAIAGVAAIAFALRNLLSGKLSGMVNPLHVLGASLWLGTLGVMVACGIVPMIRSSLGTEDREQAVAEMVHRFSLLALSAAALLGITGLWTAWTHLEPLDSLWTTPYGKTLMAKLFVVVIVLGLGAWNWRKVGPALGSDGGARTIRRTATSELAFAAVVLVLTGILVSVPSPKASRAAQQPATAASHPAASASPDADE